MTFPSYKKYRETGTGWLGAIPSHWAIDRLKHSFEKVQRPYPEDAETVTAFRDGTVTRRSNRRTEGFTEADKYIGYQGIEVGDLAIHAMDGFAGAIGVADSSGKCSPVLSVCRATGGSDPQYYAHVLRHVARSGYLTALGKGIRERSTDFRWSDARDIAVPMPPYQEQRDIVAFLDRETGKIDALIAKQERLIVALREDRTVTISRAVTRGVDPAAEMKDSGVEWLGAIPLHWATRKFRHCFRESAEKNGSVPVGEMLSVSGLRGVEVKQYEDENRRRTVEELSDYRVVRKGQLAVNTMWLNYAGLGVSKYEGHVSPAYRAYWINPGFEDRYLNYLMRSGVYVDGYTALLTGIRPNSLQMSRNDLMGFPILCPPMPEQRAIADYLDAEAHGVEVLIAKSEKMISTLHEYRSALITDAVTGKIEVQGVV
jgi:type I restriction enzyme S subunit